MVLPPLPIFNTTSLLSADTYFWASASDKYDYGASTRQMQNLTPVLIPIAVLYLPTIWGLKAFMEKRNAVDVHFFLPLWNLLLGVFSLFGVIHLLPILHHQITTRGFLHSVCSDEFVTHPNAYWILWFNLSKFPEFIDTIFLRLRKKPVIFLHWYHHIATALYCWYSHQGYIEGFGHLQGGRVLYFVVMNFLVHTIMYSYYFMASIGHGKVLEQLGINVILTAMQLTQMGVGVFILIRSVECQNLVFDPADARSNNLVWWTGLAMYSSYFYLFAKLFVDKYLSKAPSKLARDANANLEKKME